MSESARAWEAPRVGRIGSDVAVVVVLPRRSKPVWNTRK
jgi:hypothetical protein